MGHTFVQVEFEDSPRELYTYQTGGLELEVGDLVVTPAPSSPGRFGYQRYNRQGVAAVIRFGRGKWSGPTKTLTGKITTKSGRTKKARWFMGPSAAGVTDFSLTNEISGQGYSRQQPLLKSGESGAVFTPAEMFLRNRVEELNSRLGRHLDHLAEAEGKIQYLLSRVDRQSRRLSLISESLNNDTHTHDGRDRPPKYNTVS